MNSNMRFPGRRPPRSSANAQPSRRGYLDALKGHRLLPASGPARWRVLKLQVLGGGLLDAAVPRRGEVTRPAALIGR